MKHKVLSSICLMLFSLQTAHADSNDDWETCLNSRVQLGENFGWNPGEDPTDFYYPREALEAANENPVCPNFWRDYLNHTPRNEAMIEAQSQLMRAMDEGWIDDLRNNPQSFSITEVEERPDGEIQYYQSTIDGQTYNVRLYPDGVANFYSLQGELVMSQKADGEWVRY